MGGNGTSPSESAEAVRLLEHNLIKIQDLLGASRFAYVERSVEFLVPQRGEPAQRISGQLGDWLVPDGKGGWRIQPDNASTDSAQRTDPASEVQEPDRSVPQGTSVAARR